MLRLKFYGAALGESSQSVGSILGALILSVWTLLIKCRFSSRDGYLSVYRTLM